jgi:CrcB protein
MTWLAVAVGGAIGSVARHGVNQWVQAHALALRFPLGTALVNVAGCLVIGLLAGAIGSQRIALSSSWREFVFIGLLGGFTTFSTFGLETLVLGRTQSPQSAALNVAIQVAGGLAAVWLGYRMAVRA